MKRRNLLFCLFGTLLACCLSIGAWADKVEVDGIYYELLANNKASVTYPGTSEPSTSSTHYSGEVTIPSSFVYNDQTYTVTELGTKAFFGCTGVTTVNLPSTLTSIGNVCFQHCTFSEIDIPDGVTYLGDWSLATNANLTTVHLPESITSINHSLFRGCTGLTEITIPQNVTSFVGYSFNGASNLSKIIIQGTSVITYDNTALPNSNYTIIVPNSAYESYSSTMWVTKGTISCPSASVLQKLSEAKDFYNARYVSGSEITTTSTLTTNSPKINNDGTLGKLLDNNTTTFAESWNNYPADNAKVYFEVDASANPVARVFFKPSPRSSYIYDMPTAWNVYGSNDGSNWTPVTTLATNGSLLVEGQVYTYPLIDFNTNYSKLKFEAEVSFAKREADPRFMGLSEFHVFDIDTERSPYCINSDVAASYDQLGSTIDAVETRFLAGVCDETDITSLDNALTTVKNTIPRTISFTYNYTINGAVVHSETVSAITGLPFPQIEPTSLPAYVSASAPEGNVTAASENQAFAVPCTITTPFTFYPENTAWADINDWYLLKMNDNAYVEYDASIDEYCPMVSDYEVSNIENYAFAFVGDPFNGFKLYNYAADDGYVLTNKNNIGNNDATAAVTYAVMRQESSLSPGTAEGNDVFRFVIAREDDNRFYLGATQYEGSPQEIVYMNRRNNKLAYWTGRNTSSAFTVKSISTIWEETTTNTKNAIDELSRISALYSTTDIASTKQTIDNIPTATASQLMTAVKTGLDYVVEDFYSQAEGKMFSIHSTFSGTARYLIATPELLDARNASLTHEGVFQLEYAGQGKYYLKGVFNDVYAKKPTAYNVAPKTSAAAEDTYFVGNHNGTENNVYFAALMTGINAIHFSTSYANYTCGWDYDANASQWVLTSVSDVQYAELLKDVLTDAIALAQERVGNELNQYAATAEFQTALAAAKAIDLDAATADDLTLAIKSIDVLGLSINQPTKNSYIRIHSVRNGMGYVLAETDESNHNRLKVGSKGESAIFFYDGKSLIAFNSGKPVVNNSEGSPFLSLGEIGGTPVSIEFGYNDRQVGTYYVKFGARYLAAVDNATSVDAGSDIGDTQYSFWLEAVSNDEINTFAQTEKDNNGLTYGKAPLIDSEYAPNIIELGDVNNVCKNLVITDGVAFSAPVNFVAQKASYTRPMSNEWGTLCLPYAVEPTANVKYYDISSINDGVLVVEELNSVEAGQPVLVRKIGEGADITASAEGELQIANSATPTSGTVQMVGTFEQITIQSEDDDHKKFYIRANQFWNAKNQATLPAFRAYFLLSGASANSFSISIDEDDLTAVGALTGEGAEQIEAIYTLDGKKVETLQQGLNIIKLSNGKTKKILMK